MGWKQTKKAFSQTPRRGFTETNKFLGGWRNDADGSPHLRHWGTRYRVFMNVAATLSGRRGGGRGKWIVNPDLLRCDEICRSTSVPLTPGSGKFMGMPRKVSDGTVLAYGEVVAPSFGRCKNYYDSWERVMQRQTERHIVAKNLKSRECRCAGESVKVIHTYVYIYHIPTA